MREILIEEEMKEVRKGRLSYRAYCGKLSRLALVEKWCSNWMMES